MTPIIFWLSRSFLLQTCSLFLLPFLRTAIRPELFLLSFLSGATTIRTSFASWPGNFSINLTLTLPVDGVLLALHGSMVADGTPDVEGTILQALRAILGEGIPLVATLDLHANVTPLMVRQADALVLYHTAPHIDVFETGQRGA